jgi:uncharacterized repeat protein (TIGR01451 family)
MKTLHSLHLLAGFCLAVGLWCWAGEAALAAEISHCAAFPPSANNDCSDGPVTPTNWTGALTLPQFDPSLGTLNAVQVSVRGFVQGDVQYENTGPNAAVISATHAVTISISLPNSLVVRSIPSRTRVDLVPAFDQVLDFGGSSGRTFAISNTENVSMTLISASEMAPFIGLSTLSMPAEALGVSFIRGPGNLSALLRAQAASVVVAITYSYSTPGIDIIKYTNGRDADNENDGDVPQIPVGDTVTWTYLVRNTGTITFTQAEVTVTDDQPGVSPQLDVASDAGGDGLLSPNETWLYVATLPAQNLTNPTAGTTIVPGCDPGNTGNIRPTYRNIGTVTAQNLSANDPSHYCNPAPGIEIKKFTNGADADNPNDPDVPAIAPGDTVTWTYIVTNTGTISYPVTSVVVSDSQPGVTPVLVDNGDGDGFLAPNEVWRYQVSQPAQNLLNASVGTVVVPGCDPSGTGLTSATYRNIGTVVVDTLVDFDPSHYCNQLDPAIDIEKWVNGADADDPNGPDVPPLVPGETVNWVYRVTNTGDVAFPLASITVTDSQTGVTPIFDPLSDAGNDQILSPGETWLYFASAVVQDLKAPTVGTVIVEGCNPGGAVAPGPRETYRNIGTVVAPGAQDTDPAHYCNPPAPAIVIIKLTNGADANDPNGVDVPVVAPGEIVTWTYLVTNTGNIAFALDEVVVTDSDAGVTPLFDPTSDDGDALLSPGESWRYRATGQAEDMRTPAPGTVTVVGCDPQGTSGPGVLDAYRNIGRVVAPGGEDEDPSHYCNPPAPNIAIRKFTNGADANDPNGADVPVIPDGDPVTWTFVVTNTGNLTFTLAEVSVTDTYTDVIPVFDPASDDGDGLLAPGEVWIYRASGVAAELETATGLVIVIGCDAQQTLDPRKTYFNMGTVRAGGLVVNDPSHYCNPPPNSLAEEEEPDLDQPRLLLPLVQVR